MKNILRSREYMKLARSIRSCLNLEQLNTLLDFVQKYHKDGKRDSAELLALYIEKESELSPDNAITYIEDEFLNQQHRQLSK